MLAQFPGFTLEHGAFGVVCVAFGVVLWFLLTKLSEAIKGNTAASRAIAHSLITMQSQFLVHDLTTRGLDNTQKHKEEVCKTALEAYNTIQINLKEQQKVIEDAMKEAAGK